MSRNEAEPRLIRPVPDPLALYIHAGRNGQSALNELLARRDGNLFGIVIDATSSKSQRELRDVAAAAKLDLILDPRTQASATAGGYTQSMGKLPWGETRPHDLSDFTGLAGRNKAAQIASFALDNGFSQVMAPTHLLSSSSDPWLDADLSNVQHLRNALDKIGGGRVQIAYPLAISYATLRSPRDLEAIIDLLPRKALGSVWLQVEGLGSDATAAGVRNYISAATEFRRLGLPLIADGIGGLAGLALLAFGAAGGLGHGITVGERIDRSAWRRVGNSAGFGQPKRVYFPDLDLMIEAEEADALLKSSTRALASLGCRDRHCCPRGHRDMIENPARHFLYQRMKQTRLLGSMPPSFRAAEF